MVPVAAVPLSRCADACGRSGDYSRLLHPPANDTGRSLGGPGLRPLLHSGDLLAAANQSKRVDEREVNHRGVRLAMLQADTVNSAVRKQQVAAERRVRSMRRSFQHR